MRHYILKVQVLLLVRANLNNHYNYHFITKSAQSEWTTFISHLNNVFAGRYEEKRYWVFGIDGNCNGYGGFCAIESTSFSAWSCSCTTWNSSKWGDKEAAPVFIGVNVRGLYTSLQHERYPDSVFPKNYYEDSFRLIHDAGMNAVRYVFYWEAYEKNPELFMQELQTVAKTADRYGIKVIYDNHKYQH